MMADIKECFIIMPLTVPEHMMPFYRDGQEHFSHVLDYLFIPAIKKAGYSPKPPIAKGADFIHKEIIKNLETADIVLCDMSCLNPNVFFEYGIRTALNKPVCVVKDNKVMKVPFDTVVLNYHEYDSALEPWKLDIEKEKLTEHIKISVERSKGENPLWKDFGMKFEAVPAKFENTADAKLDYIRLQIDSLGQRLSEFAGSVEHKGVSPDASKEQIKTPDNDVIFNEIQRQAPKGIDLDTISFFTGKTHVKISYRGIWSVEDQKRLALFLKRTFGFTVEFNALLNAPQKPSKKGL